MAHQNTASSSMMEWVIKLPKKVFILTCLCWLNYTEFCCFCFFKQVPGVWEVKPSQENTALWPIPMSSLRVHPEYIYFLNDPHWLQVPSATLFVSALLTESPEDNSYKITSSECTNPMTNSGKSDLITMRPVLSSPQCCPLCTACTVRGQGHHDLPGRPDTDMKPGRFSLWWIGWVSSVFLKAAPPPAPTAALYSGSSPPLLICPPSASDRSSLECTSMEWVDGVSGSLVQGTLWRKLQGLLDSGRPSLLSGQTLGTCYLCSSYSEAQC